MADQRVKRPLDRDHLDLEPSKRKQPCNPCTTQGSDSSSALLFHTQPVKTRDERKRLLYVMRQVSDESIVKRIRKELESDLAVSNSCLIQPVQAFWTQKIIHLHHIKKCTDSGEAYDSRYNKETSANLCRQEHRIERTSTDVCGTGWECTKYGQEWVCEYDDCIDDDDVGYCYEGLHEASDEGPRSEGSDLEDRNCV